MYNRKDSIRTIQLLLSERPTARANVTGSEKYPDLRGYVNFYRLENGVIVLSEIWNLPEAVKDSCPCSVFGFHIHSGGECVDAGEEPFKSAGSHYNTASCPHPCHAGDMPPLFGNDGYAFSMFFTDRFRVRDIVGKTVIIHTMPDDFTTQPAGNSGERIACGVIRR